MRKCTGAVDKKVVRPDKISELCQLCGTEQSKRREYEKRADDEKHSSDDEAGMKKMKNAKKRMKKEDEEKNGTRKRIGGEQCA